MLGRVSVCFAGGVFGGLVSAFGAWLSGAYGWTAALGVSIVPRWEADWVYPQLVHGGLWGLLFLLPAFVRTRFWRGFWVSLPPTMMQLLVVFPQDPKAGYGGLHYGEWTPLYVLLVNIVWGWATACWVMSITDESDRLHRLH